MRSKVDTRRKLHSAIGFPTGRNELDEIIHFPELVRETTPCDAAGRRGGIAEKGTAKAAGGCV